MAMQVEILEFFRGTTVKLVETVKLDEEGEAAKFCERFNKVNVPTDKKVQAVSRYFYARLGDGRSSRSPFE